MAERAKAVSAGLELIATIPQSPTEGKAGDAEGALWSGLTGHGHVSTIPQSPTKGKAGDAVGGNTTLWSDIDRLRAWVQPEAPIQLIYAATEAPIMQWFVDSASRSDDARIPTSAPAPSSPARAGLSATSASLRARLQS